MRRPDASVVFGCAAVLLGYPSEDFAGDLEAVAEAVRRLPSGRPRAGLASAVGWLKAMGGMDPAATYVDTFDMRRGTSLYLTYYRHGDTRERGMALTALVDAFRQAGFAVVPGELPDFLPALLELAASHPAGAAVLGEHRMALDALALALEERGSGYAQVVRSVIEALPGPRRADRRALDRYRAQGPPSEQVGLEPFAPPSVVAGEVARR
ncbi:MAG TPA: nitrate reductase molybdenum cofactor assembly chaperone [Acidimicrobiales bacterium]|nr:nitrate reductase molybdenum cofactor assembly chaperone [Acidimicrobiales bacterium]